MKKIEELKVLYLAHYAPEKKVKLPLVRDLVYATYHYRMYEELIKIFPNMVSSNDVSTLLKNDFHPDFIFSLYNRMPFKNSEIFISSVAEYLKIPYLGATPNIRALAEDKHLSKMMAKYLEVPTPKWKIYNIGDDLDEPSFPPPYFVKPRFGAASKYITEDSVSDCWEGAKNYIIYLHNAKEDVILEQQIEGVYHTSPVLNNFNNPIFLPCISQRSTHKHGIVTYEQKRKIESGLTRDIVSDKELNSRIQMFSKLMFSIIQPLDYTRFDYIVDKNGTPFFLEFNVCCNLGEHSTMNQASNAIGITYSQLIQNITFSSLYRNNIIKESFGKNL